MEGKNHIKEELKLKPEEFKVITDELLQNHTDQAKVSTLLSTLVDDYNKESAEKSTAIKTSETLTIDNEKLRQANMSLFLKVGETKPEEKKPTEDTTPKFEDLFDEKGNLK